MVCIDSIVGKNAPEVEHVIIFLYLSQMRGFMRKLKGFFIFVLESGRERICYLTLFCRFLLLIKTKIINHENNYIVVKIMKTIIPPVNRTDIFIVKNMTLINLIYYLLYAWVDIFLSTSLDHSSLLLILYKYFHLLKYDDSYIIFLFVYLK
jgi:hypothetical protein